MKKPFVRAIALSMALFVLLTGVFFFASSTATFAANLNMPQNGSRTMQKHRHHRGKRRTTISWRKRHHRHHHKRRTDTPTEKH